MREQIIALRKLMQERGISAWICPSSDAHSSEYLAEYDKQRQFLSGFTGSQGTLLVTLQEAFLWTDGRYFVQAERELADSGIVLMRMGEKGVPTLEEHLAKELGEKDCLGFSARLLGVKTALSLVEKLNKKGVRFRLEEDIVGILWTDRPKRNANFVFVLGEEFAGESSKSKLQRMREKIKEHGGDAALVTSLADIAWLSNMRGSDIACNPQFLSYLYVTEEEAVLFMQEQVVTEEIRVHLQESGIKLRDYDSYDDYIAGEISGKKIVIDDGECNYQTYLLTKEKNELIFKPSILGLFKMVKNETEIQMTRNAHIRDGVYKTRFLKWLKESMQKGECISELEAADYLNDLRSKDLKYLSLSFETISAYGANAAMPHYTATEESFAYLEPKGLYLIDSGATYMDGTTDVTRTLALGELSKEERCHFTLATIGMLRLMNAKFPEGAHSYNLDTLARAPIWEHGLDYNHGTGHGVGFCNGVHEGPVAIRHRAPLDMRMDIGFAEGMIVSDEPGVYIAGSHGVRCENLLVTIKAQEKGFLCFEALTMIPLDASSLEAELMSPQDIACFNAYQALVYSKLEGYLNEEEKEWLRNETRPIGQ